MTKQGKFFVFNKAKFPLRSVLSTIPNIKDGEILVKIDYATLCGSDLHTFCHQKLENTLGGLENGIEVRSPMSSIKSTVYSAIHSFMKIQYGL